MLKAITSTDTILLNVEDYSITEKYDGLDVLEFSIPITDAGYQSIYEETPILEEQRYLIKAIDAGKTSATVKCQLDLDELRADMHLAYSNGSDTLVSTLEHIIPSGWTVVDKAYLSIRRTVESDAATTYDIIDACRSTYGVVFRFDNQARTITVLEPSQNKCFRSQGSIFRLGGVALFSRAMPSFPVPLFRFASAAGQWGNGFPRQS